MADFLKSQRCNRHVEQDRMSPGKVLTELGRDISIVAARLDTDPDRLVVELDHIGHAYARDATTTKSGECYEKNGQTQERSEV